MSVVLVEEKGTIATLRLNRPEVRNALNPETLQTLKAELDRLAAKCETRCLVIAGSEEAFCAGADLKAGIDASKGLGAVLDAYYHPLVESLIAFPAPTIAVVEGVATGAGLSLALLCDMVLVEEGARLSLRFSQIGLVPDTGASWTVPQRIGHARAMALMLTGKEISGKEAEKIGLVAASYSTSDLWPTAHGLAFMLSQGATATLVRIRKALMGAQSNSLIEQLALEAELQTEAGAAPDFAEAIAAFMAKRPPVFSGK